MRTAAAILLFAASGALADAGRSFDLKSGTVTYTAVHPAHAVKGTTKKLEGRAVLLADGSAKVQVRAPIASFDSGNSNRDAHMREATHELVHPNVTVKGKLEGLTLPLSGPVEKTLQGVVEMNGQKLLVPIPATLSPEGQGIRVRFSFPISLDALKIERPQLLLIKVSDKVQLEGDLLFEESPK